MAFHHQMALVMHACEKLLHHYQMYWMKHMDKSRKMEGGYHEQRWTTRFLWKKGIKPSHIILKIKANEMHYFSNLFLITKVRQSLADSQHN
jgi:hypothetical protein